MTTPFPGEWCVFEYSTPPGWPCFFEYFWIPCPYLTQRGRSTQRNTADHGQTERGGQKYSKKRSRDVLFPRGEGCGQKYSKKQGRKSFEGSLSIFEPSVGNLFTVVFGRDFLWEKLKKAKKKKNSRKKKSRRK